jgi:hypothetical protein
MGTHMAMIGTTLSTNARREITVRLAIAKRQHDVGATRWRRHSCF